MCDEVRDKKARGEKTPTQEESKSISKAVSKETLTPAEKVHFARESFTEKMSELSMKDFVIGGLVRDYPWGVWILN